MNKYANTALVKVADRHDICYIFENVMVRGPQKQCSWVSDLQINKHKYVNTALAKVADRHDRCYIFEKVMVRGPKKQCSWVSDFQIHKYKYTDTQIQIHRYTNTALVKVADRHDRCYIFEKVMVRGPQKQCS